LSAEYLGVLYENMQSINCSLIQTNTSF
jgi:hypothetical protein